MSTPTPRRLMVANLRRENRSGFCQHAIALRESRGLTQLSLAARAKVSLALIKNIELDRAVRIDSVATIYRDGLKISPSEFQTLAFRWLERYLHQPMDLMAMAETASGERSKDEEQTQIAIKILTVALRKLPMETYGLFARLAKVAAKDPNALRAVSFLVDYADKH